MSYMSGVVRAQQIKNNQFQNSKVRTNSEQVQIRQPFNVQLTGSQANVISKILPPFYSVHIDRTIKTKRNIKKKFTLDSKMYKNLKDGSDEGDMAALAEQPVYESIQTINHDQMLRKCQKILNLLKKNKNSWPFKQPVDPIVMGIPHYLQIVTNPMDLRTIDQNLMTGKYSTISQFYADVQLIISNSYLFNKNNVQFYSITSQFQKYFLKLKCQPILTTKTSQLPMIKKLSTKTPSMKKQPDTNQFLQRKQLATKLKYLPKQELMQLIHKMNNGEGNHQLNLQTLSMEKIKFLQDYVQKKETAVTKVPEVKNAGGDQSSFQSDSDS